MSERFEQTYGEVPPEYLPNASEVAEPARLFEPQRNPGITPDRASVEAQRNQQPDETIEIDMTIGVGEDPGWHRARPAPQWKGAGRAARQEA
jgi:hypothetical protein